MYYIGIDIGGTKISVVLSDDKYKILKKVKFYTDINEEPIQIMNNIVQQIKAMLNSTGVEIEKIKSIGISCGGPLDSKKGIIVNPPNLPKWINIKIKEHFETALNISTYLLNDANACCVAEWKIGAGRGYKNIIFLTFGTGIGAGLILDGKLYLGANDQAGEVGHIRIDNEGPYGYGKKGSFESYCSGAGIRALALLELEKNKLKSSDVTHLNTCSKENINAALIFELAEKGDDFCNEIIQMSARKLGLGLAILIDLLNPELIIIGSIYSRSESYFKEIIHDVIEQEALPINRDACKIVPAMLGEEIGDYAALITASFEY